MISAYLFINLEVDQENVEVLDSIQNISEVQYAFRVYGTYDIVMLIDAETTNDLRAVILQTIRKLKFVRSTMTLLSLASYKREP